MNTTTLPQLRGTTREDIEKVIHFVDANVRRIRWDNSTLQQKFLQRTALQILNDGTTHYMGPCWDLTTVTNWLFRENGIPAHLIVERLIHKEQGITLHLATQLPGRYLDHLGDNQTHSHPGTYQGWTNEKRVTTFVYTLPPAIATPEKNLITTLEEGGYEQKINDSEGTDKPSETLEGLFQAKMRQALQANTPTNFEQWLRKTPQILQLTYA